MTNLDPSSISQSEGYTPNGDLCFSGISEMIYQEFINEQKKHRPAVEGLGARKRMERGGGEMECIYHAPYFAIETQNHNWQVRMGNCHHWDCPRCGVGRAKREYWRIVQGCDEITKQGYSLQFITITTRGAGLSVAEAEEKYLLWTNRLFSNLRYQTKRDKGYWCYVQVTERQERRHPHSHILTTYKPMDLIDGTKRRWHTENGRKVWEDENVLRSKSLSDAVCACGLGEQYDISRVRDASAVARYVGKYLFKSSLLTTWPAKWRRVRYSENWPKTAELENDNAFPLIHTKDWFVLATLTDKVVCPDEFTADKVKNYLCSYGVKVKVKGASDEVKR